MFSVVIRRDMWRLRLLALVIAGGVAADPVPIRVARSASRRFDGIGALSAGRWLAKKKKKKKKKKKRKKPG